MEVYGGLLCRGNIQFKGPESGMYLVNSRNSKEANLAEAKVSRGQKLGDDMKEKTNSDHIGLHRLL